MGRAVQPGEPLWLDEDRDWALALAEVEAGACPDCGQDWEQASDPANESRWGAQLARCHACAAAARAVTSHEKDGGDMRGLHVHIIRPTVRGTS
jgi:hypothetical protein